MIQLKLSRVPKARDVIWLKTSWCCWWNVPTQGVWIFSYLFLTLFLFFKIWKKKKKKGEKVWFWLTLLMNVIPFYSRRDTTVWSSNDMWILKIEKSDLWKRSDWQLCKLTGCTHSVDWIWPVTVQFSPSLPHWDAPGFFKGNPYWLGFVPDEFLACLISYTGLLWGAGQQGACILW